MNQWNAADYARHSRGQERWGRELIEQLNVARDDDVIDIGCGDGRLTAAIAALTIGRVLGVDNSPEMVAHANANHADARLRFEQADAAALTYRNEFSLAFSNAALHWVPGDHRDVLAGIARALRSGGRGLLQMGGRGNGAAVIAAFDSVRAGPAWRTHFAGFTFPYGFHTPDDYRRWATEEGLVVEDAQLLAKDMVHADRDAFVGWLRTAWLPFVEPVPAPDRDAYIEEVTNTYLARHPVDADGTIHVDMRRLQVRLRKPTV